MEIIDQLGILVVVVLLTLLILGKPLEKLINDKKPKVQINAKVLAIDGKKSGQFYSGRMGGYNFNPSYSITFRLSNGKRKNKSVPSPEYEWVNEGDEGILALQGTRFISFEKEE